MSASRAAAGGGRFAAATAVTAAPADAAAPPLAGARHLAEVAEGWDIAGNTNGGYLLAIAGRAMAEATGRDDPVSVTGHFLAPVSPGPVTVTTSTIRAGRRLSTASALLADAERDLLAVLGTFGDRSSSDVERHPELVVGGPPALPHPDDCVAVEPGELFPPPFMGQVEVRLHPADAGFVVGEPSGAARMRGWFRLRGGERADAVALLCAVDALPPTVFGANLPIAWTPTVELTVHVRAHPVPGWLACGFSTRFVTGGFLEADGEVWDADGRLVAQSRQLALVPRPSHP